MNYLLPLLLSIQFATTDLSKAQFKRLQRKAIEAEAFCKKQGYDQSFCVLVDMSLHSGKYRLFVWDFEQDTVINSGLCSHGCCDGPWGDATTANSPTFKNTKGSHCSSLGKYKVGSRGYSQWGINVNYKLHGLEETNSNAYERVIVLHSWKDVPEEACYPQGTPEGWGCPAVSNGLMRKLDSQLQATSKPILFWMFP